MSPFPLYTGPLPHLTEAQMREVDRLMVESYHITLLQMMENAGRSLALLGRLLFLEGDATNRHVSILCGTGGNGGGGLVCARHFHNQGAQVRLLLSAGVERYEGVPAHQMDVCRRMGIPIETEPGSPPDLIIDALIGYGLHDAPHGRTAFLIEAANAMPAPILSLDLPSGVEATSGRIHTPAIRATATLTLALPKTGLRHARQTCGECYLADISVPPALYRQSGIEAGPFFARSPILRLP